MQLQSSKILGEVSCYSYNNEKGRMGARRCLFLAGNICLHALGLGFTGIRLRFDSHWDNRSLGQWNFVKYLAEKW